MNVFRVYGWDVFAILNAILPILAILLSIAATVLAFIFLVPEKRRERMNAFGKFLHDTLNFKYLMVEKILQALYIFSTCMSVFMGLFMLFSQPIVGICTMILGPVILRLVYEMIMMFVLLVKNVISINNKLKKQDNDAE